MTGTEVNRHIRLLFEQERISEGHYVELLNLLK